MRLPGANAKVEGALQAATPVGSAGASLVLGPDGFFDGTIFDPEQIDSYIAAQEIRLHRYLTILQAFHCGAQILCCAARQSAQSLIRDFVRRLDPADRDCIDFLE